MRFILLPVLFWGAATANCFAQTSDGGFDDKHADPGAFAEVPPAAPTPVAPPSAIPTTPATTATPPPLPARNAEAASFDKEAMEQDDDQRYPSRGSAKARGTPRPGTVGSYYLGAGAHYASIRQAAQDRAAVGSGGVAGLELGLALWDAWAFNVGFSGIFLEDKESFSELVVSCTKVNNVDIGCSGPESKRSNITGMMLSIESGYQYRFRPWRVVSFLPGLLAGYSAIAGNLTRSVGCEGCKSFTVTGLDLDGVYLAPFLRTTFGSKGPVAVTLRSQIYLTGDLAHVTGMSVEFFTP